MTAVPDVSPTARTADDLPVPTGSDVVWTVVGGMGGMLVGAVVGLVPVLLLLGVAYAALGLVTSLLGGAAGLWAALVRRRGWGARELGLVRGTRSLWHLLWEVPLVLTVGLLLTATLGPLLGLSPEDPSGSSSEPDLVATSLVAAPWSLVVGGLCVVLLLPLVEEVVFRRVLLGWLVSRVPVVAAVLLVSAAFAAVHILPVAMLYLFWMAIGAALLMLRHRSLWAPLALHATNNLLASLVAVAALTG